MKTLNALIKLLKYRPWLFLVNCVISTVLGLMVLFTGIAIKSIFDSFTNHTFAGFTAVSLVVLLFFTYMGRVGAFYSLTCSEVLYRFSMSGYIRHNLLHEIMKKPGAKAFSKPTGDILNSFKEDAFQVEDYTYLLADAVGPIVYTIVSLVVMLSIDYKITLFVFAPIIAIVMIARQASARVTKYRKASRTAAAAVNANLGEVLGAIQAIQIANAEQNIIKNFEKLNQQRQKSALADNIFSQLLSSTFTNTLSIGTGIVLLVGAHGIRSGGISVGDFSFFVYNLATISYYIQFFGMVLAQFHQLGVSLDRMIQIVDTDTYDSLFKKSPLHFKGQTPEVERVTEQERTAFDMLEVKNLSFRYPNTKGGIENINFKLRKNSFTVITGRIGSGKTTLVRTMLGLLTKEEGEILWNNETITEPASFFIPPCCAYTPQIPHLFSETVKDNILLGLNTDKEILDDSIHCAILNQDIDCLENGLDTIIGARGTKLSGGQQQRVAAARMFVRDSELLVFDDISSALDVETEMSLWNGIFKKKNKTCIAVSNRRMALKQADNVIVLKDGKIEAQGKLEELLSNCKEMQLIWGD